MLVHNSQLTYLSYYVVAQSLAVDQKPKQQQDFRTTVPIHRDTTDYQEQGRDVQRTHQAPPSQQQQNTVQHHQQQMPPLDGRHDNMQPMGGTQHAPNAAQYGAHGAPHDGGGAQYGGGWAQYGGGGAQYGGGGPQYGRGGAQYGGAQFSGGGPPYSGGGTSYGGSPGGRAQNYSEDIKNSPGNQSQHFAYPADKNQPFASKHL